MKSPIFWNIYLLLSLSPSLINQETSGIFRINPDNTIIEFKAKHFGVINVKGTFDEFNGKIKVKDGLITFAEMSIAVKSINTDSKARDKSLKSEDFLDVHHYPEISVKLDDNSSPTLLAAQLSIKNAQKPIPIAYGVEKISRGQHIIRISCEISRESFLLHFGTMDDLISDRIKITAIITVNLP